MDPASALAHKLASLKHLTSNIPPGYYVIDTSSPSRSRSSTTPSSSASNANAIQEEEDEGSGFAYINPELSGTTQSGRVPPISGLATESPEDLKQEKEEAKKVSYTFEMFCEDFDPADDTIRRLFELMMVELANKREALVHKPAAGSIRKRFGSMSNLQMSASYHGYHSQSTGNLRHSGQSSVSGSFIPGSYVPPGSIPSSHAGSIPGSGYHTPNHPYLSSLTPIHQENDTVPQIVTGFAGSRNISSPQLASSSSNISSRMSRAFERAGSSGHHMPSSNNPSNNPSHTNLSSLNTAATGPPSPSQSSPVYVPMKSPKSAVSLNPDPRRMSQSDAWMPYAGLSARARANFGSGGRFSVTSSVSDGDAFDRMKETEASDRSE
ncbi:hypothetical protein CJU89_1026 [Yarrowia sp. B02]|nr:hypothetical protein CJU89_1026 [Yarrowia sp. B02]